MMTKQIEGITLKFTRNAIQDMMAVFGRETAKRELLAGVAVFLDDAMDEIERSLDVSE